MPGSNQFLAFAAGSGANVLTPAEYAALAQLAQGFQSGIASSKNVNTPLRQSSFVAAAIAQAIADQTGAAVLDDGVIANFQSQFLTMLQKAPYTIGSAGGSANAITATFAPAVTSLINGLTVFVRAASANTSASVTFTPNSGTIAAKTIVKGSNQALVVNDIAGAGHWLELQYDSTLDKWVLSNPSQGIVSRGSQTFTSNGTFTVPAGVTTVYVSMCGGGGGGAGAVMNASAYGGAGGGGAASVIKQATSVTPGQSITVTIGAGGTGGASSSTTSSGTSGGTSSFGALISCPGGGGGMSGIGNTQGGAAGGSGGSNGNTGMTSTGDPGAGGQCMMFGAAGAASTGNGQNASGYGAGGGGIRANVNPYSGGNGSPGIVIVEW